MPNNELYDTKLLLKQVAYGDQTAFAQIVKQYSGIVYKYLLYWIKNAATAEELSQDVFMRLWEKRDKLENVDNPGGYIYVTTRNIALAALDKKMDQVELAYPDKLHELLNNATISSLALPLEIKELAQILHRAVSSLPPRRQEIFLLSRHQGLTYEEIADKLGISRSTVREHMVEALLFLRQYMKEHAGIIVSFLPWCIGSFLIIN